MLKGHPYATPRQAEGESGEPLALLWRRRIPTVRLPPVWASHQHCRRHHTRGGSPALSFSNQATLLIFS